MKRYLFNIVIEEGNNEFWESLQGKSGCDEVSNLIVSMFAEYGFFDGENLSVRLTHYEDEQ